MSEFNLNYFDVAIAIFLLWSAYRGVTRGFLVMGASLAALVLGVWGAIRFSDLTTDFLSEQFGWSTRYLSIIAFVITFTGIVILVHLLARAMKKLVKAVSLGFVDKLAGLLFGLLKTAFIVSIILVVLNSIDKRAPFIPEEHKENSVLYGPLSKLAPAIFPYLNFGDIQERLKREEDSGIEV